MSSNSTNENYSFPELFLHKFKTILLLAIFAVSSFSVFAQTVEFTVDMNALDVPSADYDNVVINGDWNGWLGWGVTLADDDADGVYTASVDSMFAAGSTIEYVVAVTGSADGYSGWGMQFGNCADENSNYTLVVGDSGTVTYAVADVSCYAVAAPVATVEFTVDMNGLEYPNSDYASVVVNGDWNSWAGWGVTLTDDDLDGVYTGSGEFTPGISFEYVVAVTGEATGWSGWGPQFGDCAAENANYTVTVGEEASITASVADVSCFATPTTVPGCIDSTACNFDAAADTDDETCTYAEVGYDCDGLCLSNSVSFNMFSPGYGDGFYGATFTISLGDDDVASGPSNTGSWFSSTDNFCLVDGCYDVVVTSNGYDSDYEWEFLGTSGNTGSSAVVSIGENGCITACTDESAENYNADAELSDNDLCEYAFVQGCMNPAACNFDELAEQDNGSCAFPEQGFDCDGNFNASACGLDNPIEEAMIGGYENNAFETFYYPSNGTDAVSLVFTAGETEANWDDFSVYDGIGDDATLIGTSTGTLANDYYIGSGNGLTVVFDSDGSVNRSFDILWSVYCADLSLLGCTDSTAFNYDAMAEYDNGSCVAVSLGCTDEAAENYDATANTDDESCEFCDPADQFAITMLDNWGDGWNGSTLVMTDGDFSLTIGLEDGFIGNDLLCLPAGCYDIEFGGGFATDESSFVIEGLVDTSGVGTYNTIDVNGGCIVGCMDETAANYNADADIDDESCMYSTIFNVDMSCSDVDFANLYVIGPFSGWWIADYNVMTDEDGDGVYTLDLWFAAGDTVEYKYLYTDADGGNGQEDLISSMVAGGTCAPVTDYSSYANRLTTTGSVNDDTYSSCFPCGTIIGCMDETATNYNADATVAGDCEFASPTIVEFSVDMNNIDMEGYNNVVVNGSWNGWAGWGVELSDADADGIWTGSAEFAPGSSFEYVVALTSGADGWSGWGQIFHTECTSYINEEGATAGTNFMVTVGEVGTTTTSVADVYCDPVSGCTDPTADNYDPNANTDDESCTYCGEFEAVLISSSDVSADGATDGTIEATGQGGSANYSLVVYNTDGIPQNPFGLGAGTYTAVVTDNGLDCFDELTVVISTPVVADNPCDIVPSGLFVDNIIHNRVVFNWSAPSAAPSHYMIKYRAVGASSWTVMSAGPVNSNEFTGTSRTRYFMEAATTYEWSIRARVLDVDGATTCQSSWSPTSQYTTLPMCANLENLAVSTEANWVTFTADAPSEEWGVWQSKGKIREAGANAYRYVNGDEYGAVDFLKGNFDASTAYEWHTKAWCTANVDANGDADPMYHSGWGEFSAFSTEDPCDAVATNLTTSTNNNSTAIVMTWDTPESGAPDHYFLELTNETTGQVFQWNNIAGNTNSKTKFGQTAGDQFSWRIRGACGANGTSWATSFTAPVYYTLGGDRIGTDVVANLDVYPNPSKDIFNVTFTSEEAQTMTVKVVNMIGEEVYTEALSEFVGQYTKVIDMSAQPKGVYFLEINTANGSINNKVVLQ